MSVTAKKVVNQFLESDVFLDPDLFCKHFSDSLKVYWHASSGYREFDYADYYRLCESTAASYKSMRTAISHIFSQKDEVAARFTVYVKTLENPTEEIPIGYFISIFTVDDGKIREIHQSSHPSQN